MPLMACSAWAAGLLWSLRFNVENVTDERTAVSINEITTGPGHFVQYPEPPRLLTAQLRYQF